MDLNIFRNRQIGIPFHSRNGNAKLFFNHVSFLSPLRSLTDQNVYQLSL
jgi:hypothetical protein